jgi:hypothetical protein
LLLVFKLVGRIFSNSVGFFVLAVSSSSVLIFIGDNGVIGGGGCLIFSLSSSTTRNLDNAFSAVTTNVDDDDDGGDGKGDSIVVYVFKVASKRAFARRFFPVLLSKMFFRTNV